MLISASLSRLCHVLAVPLAVIETPWNDTVMTFSVQDVDSSGPTTTARLSTTRLRTARHGTARLGPSSYWTGRRLRTVARQLALLAAWRRRNVANYRQEMHGSDRQPRACNDHVPAHCEPCRHADSELAGRMVREQLACVPENSHVPPVLQRDCRKMSTCSINTTQTRSIRT